MLTNAEKVECIATLHTFKNDPAVVALVKLLDYYIEEMRQMNDTAEDIGYIKRHQGSISTCLMIKGYIDRGAGPTSGR
jgi:hypothetical protein